MPPREVPVSVVIPCYRCADTIGRALESVLAQTARPREVILVDDASGDGTLAVLRAFAARHTETPALRVLPLPENLGAASARNAGWEAASGEYVAFLDADDSWHPRKLELQAAWMSAHPQACVSGHLHVVTPGSIAAAPVQDAPPVRMFVFRDFLWRNRFVTSAAMLRRDCAWRFPEGQRHMEDHRLWLDITRGGTRAARLEAALAAHHKADFGAGGLSAQLWAMERAELANYAWLHREGAIGRPLLAILHAWSCVKFVRRLLVVGLSAHR